MIKITELLANFAERCEKKLNLRGIMQFGSSTYSKNPKDIDLVFFSNNKVFSTKDYLKLFELIKEFENKFEEISFNIAGGKRIRKTTYSISIIPLQNLDLDWKIDPFFIKNLSEDKNKKMLFGPDPTNFQINFDNKQVAERLSLEINHHLRDCLDEDSKQEALYSLFKTTLRLMLINLGVPKKEQLSTLFKEKYKDIKFPINSDKILNNVISKEDFEQILKFSEDCLLFLTK